MKEKFIKKIKTYQAITWEEALSKRISDKGWKPLLIFCIPIYGVINHSLTRKTISPFSYWLASRILLSIPAASIYENSVTYTPVILWGVFSGILEILMIKLAISHDRKVAKRINEKNTDEISNLKVMEIFYESLKLLVDDIGLGMIFTNLENKNKVKKENKLSENFLHNKGNIETRKIKKFKIQKNNSDLDLEEKLNEAKMLYEKKLISKSEYTNLKSKIMGL